ncbi:MAG: RhuM family protein [Eubacteriales bacterium]|nr:RhuM family protein [Eubacteriales bacterium]
MNDWVEKLDDFIKMNGSELLQNAGKISHEEAKVKAELEYEKYKELRKNELSQVERDFLESIKTAQKMLEEKR